VLVLAAVRVRVLGMAKPGHLRQIRCGPLKSLAAHHIASLHTSGRSFDAATRTVRWWNLCDISSPLVLVQDGRVVK
jgi:hypothetical protein